MKLYLRRFSCLRFLALNAVFLILLSSIVTIKAFSNNKTGDTNNLKKVRLQLKWLHQFQFAGFYAAIEKGYYKEAGLVVELIEGKTEQESMNNVYDGKAEFGVSTCDIIIDKDKGRNPLILAAIFQHSPQVLIASKKSGIGHIHDLTGKRIMLEPLAAAINTYMKAENVFPEKNTIVAHSFNVEDLINGKVDAMSGYITDEPFLLEENDFDYTILSPLSGGIDFYGDLLYTTSDYAKKNPEITERFILASMKGWKYAMKNKEELVDIIFDKYSQRHSKDHLLYEAIKMESLMLPDVVEIGYINPGRISSIIQQYKELKLINTQITSDSIIYRNKPLKAPVNWYFILITLLVITIISILAFVFYRLNKQLRKEMNEHKILEEFLKESRETYRILTENMKDVVWILDSETMYFTYVSPSVYNLRGFTPEEIMAEPMDFALTEGESEFVKSLIKQRKEYLLNNPTERKFYNEIIEQPCKDGTTVWTEVTTHYFYNEISKKVEVHGVTRDITERRKAESEYRKLSVATEQSPVSIVITNLSGDIEYVNPNFTELTGYTRDEVYGKNPRILQSGNSKADIYKNMWQELTDGKTWRGEFENKKKNGDIYYEWAVISPIIDEVGRTTHFIAVKEDITLRRKIENALKESEEKFRLLTITTSTGIFVIQDSRFVMANPAMTNITEYSNQELLSMSELDLIHSDYKDKLPLNAFDSLNNYEIRINTKSGVIKWIYLSTTPINYLGKNAIIGSVVDITERILMENKLSELNNTKDKFFSIIAHDLRNPIGTFTSMTKLLIETYDEFDKDERLSFLEAMKSSAENIFNLLINLLEWSNSQRGKIRIEKRELDLFEITNNVISILKHSADNKKIKLINEIAPSIIVNTDSNILNIILRNLISNAIKYTYDYGKIHIYTEINSEQKLVISVKDTGTGMNVERLNRLFKIDNSSSMPGTANESGTGLGLLLCKEFIEKLGGKIWAESEIGKGSIFSFTLN